MTRNYHPEGLKIRGVALGRRVATLRAAAGLTQADLAKTSGVTIHSIQKLEHGDVASPGFFAVADIARALGTPLDHLADLPPVITSMGYQGLNLDDFLAEVTAAGVERVADVRLNAISRKRGFSKTLLRNALMDIGVEYIHYRGLGNPKENRPYFAGEDLARGRRQYRSLLRQPDAQRELRSLAALTHREHVAILCFEANARRCHRSVIFEELAQFG